MKLRRFLAINAALCIGLSAFTPAYSQNIQPPVAYEDTANQYFQKGMQFFNSGDYTAAITQLEQAIKLNSQDTTIRNNLAAAYINRATYQLNKGINLQSAANDYRKAMFYLKYDENISDNQSVQDNFSIAATNLKNLLNGMKISLTPKARLKLAKELRGQGNFREAVVEFNEALADASLKPEAVESLGDIMRVLQKYNKACEYYNDALAMNPENPNFHLKFAHSLNKIGDLERAVREYNIVLSINESDREAISALESIWQARLKEAPQDALVHMNLGVVLQKKGDLQGALAEYNEATRLDPTNKTIRLNMGTLFQAQGNLPMAISAYDSILQVNPTDVMAHYYRSTALKQMGKFSEAIAELQIVLSLDPRNTMARKAVFETIKQIPDPNGVLAALQDFARNNPNDYLAQYNLAFELHSQKQLDPAIDFYKRTIFLYPQFVDSYLNLASIYKEKGMFNDAGLVLKDALKVSPDSSKIKDMIAQIDDAAIYTKFQQAAKLYDEKNYEGAVKAYLDIINTSKPTSDVYTGLGAAYQSMKNSDEAVKAYTKAIELDKDNFDAYYYLGGVYYEKNNNSKALEYYKKALVLNPDNKEIKDAIGAIKLASAEDQLKRGLDEYSAGSYQKALVTFNGVLSSFPDNGYAYYYRGMTYDALGKYKLAIPDYQKALQKTPSLTEAYYSMAVNYDSLKLYVDAKKSYQKYLSLAKDPSSEYVKYTKQRLKQLK